MSSWFSRSCRTLVSQSTGIEDLWHKNRFYRCSSELPEGSEAAGSNIYQLVILLTNFLPLSSQQTERSRHELRFCYQKCTATASSLVYNFNRRREWALISFLCVCCSLVSCFTTPKFSAKPLIQTYCSKQNIFSVLQSHKTTRVPRQISITWRDCLFLRFICSRNYFFELHNLLAHLPQLSLLFQKPFRSNFLPMPCEV